MSSQVDKLMQFKELALGSRLKRLSDHMMKETSLVYSDLGVDFDPYHMPIFKLVHEQPGLTISEISAILKVTQPAITQYVNSLIKKGLVRSKVGKIDKRKRKITSSHQGKKLYKELQPIWEVINNEVKSITGELSNKTLLDHVTYVEKVLSEKSFSTRVLERFKLNTGDLKIVGFREEYASNFRDMNLEWLEKYFYVEAHDKEVLNNAKSYILDNGGYIFFALYNEEVAGTVALISESEGYELSKMAVSPKFQGKKIGQVLMQYCIDFAKEQGWKQLLLYSNTILENAIYIYRKYGFEEVELEKDSPYQRSNIKMVLEL